MASVNSPVNLDSGTQAMVLVAFMLFVGAALLLSVSADLDSDEISDFYTAKRSFTPFQNGLALAGDYISAITLLSTTGVIALWGFDGLTVALCIALALSVLLVLSQPLRNVGRYTLGDVFALRAPGKAARIAAATATLVVSLPYLMVQLSGAGSTTALLVGLTDSGSQQVCTALIGVLMVVCTVLGGMKGTSLVQILKIVLISGAMLVVAVVVLFHFHWNISSLLGAAAQGSGHPDTYLHSGLYMGSDTKGRLDLLSLQLSLVLGAGSTPHMLMRVNASPTGAASRRATRYALTVVAGFCLLVGVVGLGASAVIGKNAVVAVDPHGFNALLMLSDNLAGGTGNAGGSILFTAMACAVFMTVLAVVSGITLAAAGSLANDLLGEAVLRNRLTQSQQVRAARWAVLVVGVLGILFAILAQGYNIQFLTSLAMAAAASAILPSIVYSLYWDGFNRTGLLWAVYGGLLCSVGLYAFSPAVSGAPTAAFPGFDWHWFPLQNSSLVSVPAAFLLGWLGSRYGQRRGTWAPDPAEVRAKVLTGAGTS